MIIKNAFVYRPDFAFHAGEVYCSNGVFSDAPSGDALDAEGLYLVPGFIDTHIHGAAGRDFSDGSVADIAAMAEFLASRGVTAFTPASMTLPEEDMNNIADAARTYKNGRGAAFAGIYMEGPFFNEKKKGAQKADFLRNPDLNAFRTFNERSGGAVKTACVAPELPGAEGFIREVSGICAVSVAHTEADYDVSMTAFNAGAARVTHTFNAMPPFTHRAPGVVGAACDAHAYAELICDGIHLHPAVIRAAVKMFGDDRVVFVSDSMRAAGLSDGAYTLGGQAVTVSNMKATLADGTIAGSVADLGFCVRNAVKYGIEPERAIRFAAANPAEASGLYDTMGSVEPGKAANFLLCDRELNVRAVYINGEKFNT